MRPLLAILCLIIPLLTSCSSSKQTAGGDLDPALVSEIQALGHKNWIVLADQSFPLHTRRGVRTLLVNKEIPEVLDGVLNVIESQQHVGPNFYRARELAYVKNDNAPGIDLYRQQIDTVFKNRGYSSLVRDMQYRSLSIILEDQSKTFAVLVIKTNTALPYSALFIELENGYWSRENEQKVRAAIEPTTA